MVKDSRIAVVDDDGAFLNALEKSLALQRFNSDAYVFCTFVGTEDSALRFEKKPVRVGAVMDRLLKALKQRDEGDSVPILIGDWIFDGVHSQLVDSRDDQKTVKLTEKEQDILQFLYDCDERCVSRDALLAEVWGYVDGVETHTIETHIYRLRQKIERDPTDPRILITTQEGYRLIKPV